MHTYLLGYCATKPRKSTWLILKKIDLFLIKSCPSFRRRFIVPLENFSLIWRRHHYRWRAANFALCSALMAIEQRGFSSVPHLLWHGASLYNGHLWGPVTLTPIAERLAVELTLPVFTTYICRGWIRTPNLPLEGPAL